MEPTTGIEPVNLFLTKESLYLLSYVGRIEKCVCGAGDETRTRDIQLGRLKLYQLSYSRTRKLLADALPRYIRSTLPLCSSELPVV